MIAVMMQVQYLRGDMLMWCPFEGSSSSKVSVSTHLQSHHSD